MSSRKMILIFALPLLAACADRDLVAPDEQGAVIQAAKGGNKGKPGGGGDDGGGDDGGGTWDGTQDIVYVEDFSSDQRNKHRNQSEDRLVVVNSDGSNRAIAYSRSGSLYGSRASLSADGNAIVFGDDGGVHIIRLLDPTTGSISSPELLVPGGSQQAVSPDDSKIAYVRHEGFCEGIGGFDLYVYDRNDGTSTRITSNNQPSSCLTTDSISSLTPARPNWK